MRFIVLNMLALILSSLIIGDSLSNLSNNVYVLLFIGIAVRLYCIIMAIFDIRYVLKVFLNKED